jgi:hypothetical protein
MSSNPFKVREGLGAESANRQLGELLNKWLTEQGPNPIFRTCVSCKHMAPPPNGALCGFYNMTPPATVIVAGCDKYVDDCEIPF